MNKQIDISNVILNTERLILRAFRQSDLLDLYNYAKIDGVGQMAGWLPHKSIAESQNILDMFISGKITFAIEYQGKVIGSLGIEEYTEQDFAEFDNLYGREIGYVLAKDFWGQGIMPEAVKAVIKYLFEVEQLDFLTISHFEHNTQSQRVIEKCGFKYYNTVERHTHFGTIERSKQYLLLNTNINNL